MKSKVLQEIRERNGLVKNKPGRRAILSECCRTKLIKYEHGPGFVCGKCGMLVGLKKSTAIYNNSKLF